jgi:D-alanine-D-alanine ligase
MKLHVGVLRGGPSGEYDVSLKSGAHVLKNLSDDRYVPHDIFIDREGQWHYRGLPTTPDKILGQIDVVFNALHGEYGEDGTVQKVLERFAVPFTGSDAFSSAIGMNKILTKGELQELGIRMPQHLTLELSDENLEDKIYDIFRIFPQPSVIKPAAAGSSIGVVIARSFEEFVEAISQAFAYSPRIIIEEYIRGREATCGVLDRFRGDDHYTLLPVEIVPVEGKLFYDYDAKYGGGSIDYCPGNFSEDEKQELQEAARAVHQSLGLRHYSRSDFIVSPRGIYFLEVNTLPGLMQESTVAKSLDAVGCPFPEFLDHVINLALEKY